MSSDKNRDDCELAIKKTLAYRSIFKYPLSNYQLKTFLISSREFRNKTINDSLEHLLNRGFLKEKNKKYYLPGVRVIDWDQKKKLTEKIVKHNLSVINKLGKIPWVRMIAITGSVAAYNPADDSDIDVIIISAKNRLWITRLFCTLILKVLNKFPNVDGERGKICTNLYMDESKMAWEENGRNLYIAHDIVLMNPIIDKKNTYVKFLNMNRWVLDFLSNFPITKLEKNENKNKLTSPLVDMVERIFMNIQVKHMRSKLTTERVSKYLIHFNKNDNCGRILESYEKVLMNRNIR